MAEWVEWSPQSAPHVKGRYTRRTFDEDGQPEEQRWEARCETCGGSHQGGCMSGNVRSHIARFAAQHLHRDPLAPVPRGR